MEKNIYCKKGVPKLLFAIVVVVSYVVIIIIIFSALSRVRYSLLFRSAFDNGTQGCFGAAVNIAAKCREHIYCNCSFLHSSTHTESSNDRRPLSRLCFLFTFLSLSLSPIAIHCAHIRFINTDAAKSIANIAKSHSSRAVDIVVAQVRKKILQRIEINTRSVATKEL